MSIEEMAKNTSSGRPIPTVNMIGVKLVDYRGLTEIYRKAPKEFIVALVTAATVVFVGVEQGIIFAVLLSLLQHVRRSYRPRTAVVVQDQVDHWQLEEAVPGRMIVPGMPSGAQ